MNATLNDPVGELKAVLAKHLPWHGARIGFLAQFLLALFKVRSVNLAELATGFCGKAKVDSHYKRLQRFFRSFEMDEEALARLLVHLVPVGDGPWRLIGGAAAVGLCHRTVAQGRAQAGGLAAENLPEGFAVFNYPPAHRTWLRTTHSLERINRELKRRTRVASTFPNSASCLRLVSALLAEYDEEWMSGKIYLNLNS